MFLSTEGDSIRGIRCRSAGGGGGVGVDDEHSQKCIMRVQEEFDGVEKIRWSARSIRVLEV